MWHSAAGRFGAALEHFLVNDLAGCLCVIAVIAAVCWWYDSMGPHRQTEDGGAGYTGGGGGDDGDVGDGGDGGE